MPNPRYVFAGRRLGTVESAVLDVLYDAGRPLTGREVQAALAGGRRAYTTVVTMLTRLAEKELVRRLPHERGFTYEPTGTPEEMAARALHEIVDSAHNPRAVLARFVGELGDDPALLTELARIVDERRDS